MKAHFFVSGVVFALLVSGAFVYNATAWQQRRWPRGAKTRRGHTAKQNKVRKPSHRRRHLAELSRSRWSFRSSPWKSPTKPGKQWVNEGGGVVSRTTVARRRPFYRQLCGRMNSPNTTVHGWHRAFGGQVNVSFPRCSANDNVAVTMS